MTDDDSQQLPPGWRALLNEAGQTVVVSPRGRVYDFQPAGYEPADMDIFDAILDGLLSQIGEADPA